MKILPLLVVAAVLAACSVSAATNEWKPAVGPLATRWAKDISPGHVWKEYPRPQMVRKEWMNLNGLWNYAIVATNESTSTAYNGKILAPFPVESALSGVMRRVNEKQRLIYQRTFRVPKGWEGQRVLLHFGAVDWEARVFINDKRVGVHRGGYDPFTFDITPNLNSGGEQEIRVEVIDPTDKGQQARGKQVDKPEGIWYTPTSGIWQTVWLEPVPQVYVTDLDIAPDVDAGKVRVWAAAHESSGGETEEAIVLDHGKEIGRASGPAGTELEIPIPKAKLWSPEHPYLYDLKVELRQAGKRLDTVTGYFGMRKISLGKDAKGNTRLMLNNEPYFMVGPLDQGFWPDGIYTPPSDAAMRYDIKMTKKLGFNMTRKHVKVEPERWYYYCDKMGLLVWQDMPGAYLGNRTKAAKDQFQRELRRMIVTHISHPSIVIWVLFNEGWGQYDTERLTKMIKNLDPTRLVDDASGWTDKRVGDIVDKHHYPAAVTPELEANRASVQGEFGGLGLPVDGHTWTKKSWGYQGMTGRKQLTQRYVDLMGHVYDLEKNSGLSAAVYTQITDVEAECNGLMTYDREMLKPDKAEVAAANRKLQMGQ